MQELFHPQVPISSPPRRSGVPMPILMSLGLMATGLLSLIFVLFGGESLLAKMERPYLVPWVLATGVVILVPCLILKKRGEFKITNPLVGAALMYFFPMFFLGGWSLTFGLSSYHFLNYVPDPEYYFPLAFVYIMVGFAGLAIGYFIPAGKKIGNYLSEKLPRLEFPPADTVFACVLCMAIGFCVNFAALEFGQVGYQSGDITYGATGSFTSYAATGLPAASFLLWLIFYRLERWNLLAFVIVAAQSVTAIFMLVIQGGKSSLIYFAGLSIGAFVFTKPRVELKHWGLFIGVIAVCLVLGTFYGTKFRELKGSTNRISAVEYSKLAFESMGRVGESDPVEQLSASGALLAERIETVSSFAVVVSNHEALSDYEAAYGLDNSIWTYTWTAFIPRIIWKDKPVIADNYSYNELYFDHGGFGLSVTAIGDLLRNFGPIGVPLGMIVLGFGIRIFYAMLVEGVPFSMWRATVYFIVITKVGYDGFYGEILPVVIRVSMVIFLQFLFLRIVVKALGSLRR